MGNRILSEEEIGILLSDRHVSCPFCGLLAEFTDGLAGQLVELEENCALMFMRSRCLYSGETTYPSFCHRLEGDASKHMIKSVLLPNFTVNLNSKKIPAEEYFSGKIPE
jgi:hypothetical protein